MTNLRVSQQLTVQSIKFNSQLDKDYKTEKEKSLWEDL